MKGNPVRAALIGAGGQGRSHIDSLIGIAALVYGLRAPSDPLDQFWEPMLRSGKPVLMYCGQPVVYFLSPELRRSRQPAASASQPRGSYGIRLSDTDTIRGSDIIPVSDQFVGIGNAHTSSLLAVLFASRRKAVEIRYANDLSFTDLRGGPAVLIGAFSNLWTLEMQRELRFVFEQEDGVRRIRDRAKNRTWQLAHLAPDGQTPDDYVVVSRLITAGSGQPLISAAGITQYGTRSAGEFLTSQALLARALAGLPADWPRKNLQVVLHTAIYYGSPAAPRVLAVHSW